ncbi:MAG TPA: YgiQ family radical SAM protein, partial [bacterium]|nr:YgiQ family radical SAM protein [bacterium]
MFLPTTRHEMNDLGWDAADVILVTGDTYIDSPYIGVSVIGHWLMKHGFTVAVIAQPSVKSGDD